MKVVFMGSPAFAATTLVAVAKSHEVVLAVTQPDKRKGRGKKVLPPEVKVAAGELGIEVFQPRSARTGELAERLRATGAQLAIVVAYGKILPLEVLEALPLGCLNVHASLLPAYRGAAPIQWAVIDGKETTGVSIMALDEGMDTGPVYLTREVAIGERDTAGTMFEKLAPVGAAALLEVLAGLEAGTALATPQDNDQATHARMLTKADGLVDWQAPAAVVASQIRGVDPWPGAQTFFGDISLKIFGATTNEGDGAAGEVLAVSDAGLVVACGQGAVLLSQLQPAGKKRMPAQVCAHGRQIVVGSVLRAQPLTPPPTPSHSR